MKDRICEIQPENPVQPEDSGWDDGDYDDYPSDLPLDFTEHPRILDELDEDTVTVEDELQVFRQV